MIFVPLTWTTVSEYPAPSVFRCFFLLILTFVLVLPPPITEAMAPEAALALEMIHIPWQELGYEIVFMPPRAGFRAMTLPAKHRIEVYARPQDNVEMLAFDIAHELGHAIDLTYNTDESRKRWMEARGIDPDTAWFGCDRCSDYNTPAGDFAETFALLLRGPKYFRSRIALPPTSDQCRTLAAFFPDGFVPEFSASLHK